VTRIPSFCDGTTLLLGRRRHVARLLKRHEIMTSTIDYSGKTDTGNHFISNYPPYSCWTAEGIPAFERALDHRPPKGPLSLYVHLPFCEQRCMYCCYRTHLAASPEKVDRYIDAVIEELALMSSRPAVVGRPIMAVYFGGGSPSYLSADQLNRLFAAVQSRFDVSRVEEFTVECDPRTATAEKLAALRDFGVTRVSLGFQTLDDKILVLLARASERADCLAAYERARAAGIREINVDLLTGLPWQTDENWNATVDAVIGLAPDCVTIYQMDLTHNSRLHKSIQFGRPFELPNWPTKRRWVHEAYDRLERSGYEIRNAYMCVRQPNSYRLVYLEENCWKGHDLVAFGETAFGYLHATHYQNADSYAGYVNPPLHGRLPLWRVRKTTVDERLRREVILQLKTGRLPTDYFRKKFGIELADYFRPLFEKLRDKSMLMFDHDSIQLTRKGLIQVDWLLPKFYLPHHVGLRYT
jgi:oxygen-independent coproporphyrinogen-3 oxidase